jgi:Cu(I)/Ag(I) efflux system membrane fusion protein
VLEGLQANEDVVVAANFLIDAESNLKAAVGSFGHAAHGSAAPGAATAPGDAAKPTGQAKAVVHQAIGEIESIDPANTTVMLKHDAIASLKWPAMSMEFKLANAALAPRLEDRPGRRF